MPETLSSDDSDSTIDTETDSAEPRSDYTRVVIIPRWLQWTRTLLTLKHGLGLCKLPTYRYDAYSRVCKGGTFGVALLDNSMKLHLMPLYCV